VLQRRLLRNADGDVSLPNSWPAAANKIRTDEAKGYITCPLATARLTLFLAHRGRGSATHANTYCVSKLRIRSDGCAEFEKALIPLAPIATVVVLSVFAHGLLSDVEIGNYGAYFRDYDSDRLAYPKEAVLNGPIRQGNFFVDY